MSNKESNEVTVKIICNKEELIKILKDNGFKRGREFSLDDYYFIPNNIDIAELSTIDKIKQIIDNINLPIEKNKYCIKKQKMN